MLKFFPKKVLGEIAVLVKRCEQQHSAQVVVAIEARLNLIKILRGVGPFARAQEVFSKQRVWDTEHNNGVLVYLLLADKTVVILSDRGVQKLAGSDLLAKKAAQIISENFSRQNITAGVGSALEHISGFLAKYYPPNKDNKDELSDEVVIV
jgi:uncharacterized membrane protein